MSSVFSREKVTRRLFLGLVGAIVLAGCSAPPRRYVCPRATAPVAIDGRIDEPAWDAAPWSEPFDDIEGERQPPPRFQTRMKMLWDDQGLSIAARLEEPHVWAGQTQRDSVVWHENDFEVFIDPDGDGELYYEVEVNPLNTVFDLVLVKPYSRGGPALHGWDFVGMQTAVAVEGTLNDPTDADIAWTVEISLPWSGFDGAAREMVPPEPGDVWRINFSRVQWRHRVTDAGAYERIPDTREDNWSWSPQGAIDMHRPKRWGYVEFAP